MVRSEVTAAFDEISNVYDETRDPLEDDTGDRIASELRAWGVRSLLEVGIGTGRMAVPLVQRGLRVTGLDASSGMLARAKGKGLDRLVRGGAYRLPFRDRTFDAAIFVHVLHILDDASRAIAEACRVGRTGAIALLESPSPSGDRGPDSHEAREIVYECLRRRGVSIPPTAGGPRRRERKLLEVLPPDRLVVVSDREVTEPASRELDFMARRATRWTLRIPPELLAAAIEEARRQVGNRQYARRRVRALALWTRAPRSDREPTARTDRSSPDSALADGGGASSLPAESGSSTPPSSVRTP
jgi:ubiquinone/menaquinone biosynthesis C-methylase UbiE